MTSIAMEIPVMAEESSEGTGIAIPDIALVTETAGVRIPAKRKIKGFQ
jgi:hypothetical protein